MIFCGVGFSLVEKSLMSLASRAVGAKAVLFPMGGQMIHAGESRRFLRLWYRLLFASANALFCQGPRWTAFLHNTLKIRADKLVIVNCWTATPELLAIGAEREYRHDEWTTVVFIGWLEQEKGILELVRVFGKIATDYQIRLSVIGGGSLEKTIASRIAAHGLEDRVTLHGWLSPAEVAEVLAQSDVFVLPSWGEGMPNSLIEAMATKVAAIVTRVGSIPDFIVDGESGILISRKDEDDLERALVRMVTDGNLRMRCAERAYLIAKEQLTIECAIEQMKPVFGE